MVFGKKKNKSKKKMIFFYGFFFLLLADIHRMKFVPMLAFVISVYGLPNNSAD